MPEIINVCYSVYDTTGTYSKYVGTSLCSLLENTKSPVHVYILHDATLTANNRQLFTQLVGAYGQEISFCAVALPPQIYAMMQGQTVSPATLYRLALKEVLPREVELVVYLDADTIVNLDIAEMVNDFAKQHTVGAVVDPYLNTAEHSSSCPLLANGMVPFGRYFNCGVLVLNLSAAIFQQDFFLTTLNFFASHIEWCTYPDQDVLNYYLHDSCQLLTPKYNVIVNDERQLQRQPTQAIYHFANNSLGVDKNDAFDALFWHYFCRTPWFGADFVLNAIAKTIDVCQKEVAQKEKILSYPCRLFWGPAGIAEENIKSLPYFSEQSCYYHSCEEDISSPLKFPREMLNKLAALPKTKRIAILATSYYRIAKNYLINQGFKEGRDFMNGQFLLTREPLSIIKPVMKNL